MNQILTYDSCNYHNPCNDIPICNTCNFQFNQCLCQTVTIPIPICNRCNTVCNNTCPNNNNNDTNCINYDNNCINTYCNTCNVDPCCCVVPYLDMITSWEYILVFIITLLIYIPFFISYFYGVNSVWYESLIRDTNNTWIIAGLWIVTTIISYIGLYILWRDPTKTIVSRNLMISVLFFISNVILLAWAVVFYQFHNISTATWISLILFIYQFWIFIYIWSIDRLAALFFIPLVAMYLYFFYSMVHLAILNGIIL